MVIFLGFWRSTLNNKNIQLSSTWSTVSIEMHLHCYAVVKCCVYSRKVCHAYKGLDSYTLYTHCVPMILQTIILYRLYLSDFMCSINRADTSSLCLISANSRGMHLRFSFPACGFVVIYNCPG